MKRVVIIPDNIEVDNIVDIINDAVAKHYSGLSIVDYSYIDDNNFELISTILVEDRSHLDDDRDSYNIQEEDEELSPVFDYFMFNVKIISKPSLEDEFSNIYNGSKVILTFNDIKTEPGLAKDIAENIVKYTNGYLLLDEKNPTSFSIYRTASNLNPTQNHNIFKNMLLNDLNKQLSYLPEDKKNSLLSAFDKAINKENNKKNELKGSYSITSI